MSHALIITHKSIHTSVDELRDEGEYIEQRRIYPQDESMMNWEGHERKR